MPKSRAPRPAAPEHPGDDLKRISGIGSAVARRLEDAGVRTYGDMAASTPEELAAVLANVAGCSARRIAAKDWIGQARRLGAALPAATDRPQRGGVILVVDSVTDRNGALSGVIDVDQGFTVSGTVMLPHSLAGTGTVCIWADEQGGTIDRALTPCATITILGSHTAPNPTTYPWAIPFSGGFLPDPSTGSQIYHLVAKFMYQDQATDIAGFADMGLYLIN